RFSKRSTTTVRTPKYSIAPSLRGVVGHDSPGSSPTTGAPGCSAPARRAATSRQWMTSPLSRLRPPTAPTSETVPATTRDHPTTTLAHRRRTRRTPPTDHHMKETTMTTSTTLTVLVGVTPDGETVTVDLRRSHAVLVAGIAGSGKSTLLRRMREALEPQLDAALLFHAEGIRAGADGVIL